MKKCTLFLMISIIITCSASGITRSNLDRPLMIGPQYPMMYFTTFFVPDSAFTLSEGDFFFQVTYLENNAFSYTSDALKYSNPDAPPGEFTGNSNEGYSVYLDAEISRRILRTQVGISDGLELQFVFRDFKIGSGSWDSKIESFHESFQLGNQNREFAELDELHIYIRNNETGENEYVITKNMKEYRKESITLAFNMSVSTSEDDALSLTIASNYGDYLLKELNEVKKEGESDHKNFDDYVLALNYSSIFENWSLHAAVSRAFIKNSFLENTAKHIDYSFLGINWHIVQDWDIMIQGLRYSSIYPSDSASNIDFTIGEFTLGARAFITDETAFEIGFVENITQGAQNTDIAFFSSLLMTF